jgi:membrane protease YdiL (CAAX protease family)
MKKHIIPVLLILLIVFIGYINYIYPINTTVQSGEPSYGAFRYIVLIFSYILIIFTLLIEKENLEVFNIDNVTLLTLSLIGVVVVKLHVPYEEYYRATCKLLGVIVAIYSLLNWKRLPKTKLSWVLLGMLSCAIAFPLAFIQLTQIEKLDSNNLFTTKPIVYVLSNFFFALTFAPFEELVIRGVLWGQLRKWNIGENNIIWLQGIIFWLLHGYQISTPISFFISLPIMTIVFSLLVKYSKQLFPSIVSHVLINTLGPLFVRAITRN